ncbi:MAG: amidohydrolase family protein, partial [Candidatus Sericytochromatia bacterium]|nr:amidohydrolase family protein [Candidatus Tanganyikabacteria bacterium]
LRAGDTDEILLSASAAHPEHVGRTLAEIGSGVGRHPAEVTCDLLADDEGDLYSVLIQHRYSTEQDLLALMQDDFCAFESDGVVACADGRLGRLTMNRSTYGYAPRVLGELVRERRIFSLEEAVRKMTSLPADTFGLSDRGRLVDGAVADIVVFDPTTVGDRSTDRVLQAYPVGIDTVIVGGRVAFQAGEIVSRTGTILRRIA